MVRHKESPRFKTHLLKSQCKKFDLPFRVLEDSQIFTGKFEMVTDNLVYAQQDDDIDSDEDTLRSATVTCMKDMIELNNYMRMP